MNAPSSQTIEPGAQFRALSSGRTGQVGEMLGAGGQGAVYAASFDGAMFALKWYHDHVARVDVNLRNRLKRSISRKPPSDAFLWPVDLVEMPGSQSFGYLMPLRADGYRCIRDIIAPPPRRLKLSLSMRLRICSAIADSFLQLHASGFCYQDINLGNLFVDPVGGHIMVCDIDNVDVDGERASVYGTRKFMAPEVVRREALPTSKTDLFSMAVLFFYILHGWHPLDGQAEAAVDILDAEAENKLYGTEPRFIFDPDDQSNGPVPGHHDGIARRWETISKGLRKLFTRSFTRGLHEPRDRVLETEWKAAFTRMLDRLITCKECDNDVSYDATPGSPQKCGICEALIAAPVMGKVGRDWVVLGQGRTLYARHAEQGAKNPTARVGIVESHPDDEAIVGLRNLSQKPWLVTLADGRAFKVMPDKTVRLAGGMTVTFGAKRMAITDPADTPEQPAAEQPVAKEAS